MQLDLPLSKAFYKWMLNLEDTFTAQDLQHVDPVVARSFAQLAAVALKKHTLENDPLLVSGVVAVGMCVGLMCCCFFFVMVLEQEGSRGWHRGTDAGRRRECGGFRS